MKQTVEAQALQKEIRNMELELARLKANHPPEEVSCQGHVKRSQSLSDDSE
jgi:hypothetical protein